MIPEGVLTLRSILSLRRLPHLTHPDLAPPPKGGQFKIGVGEEKYLLHRTWPALANRNSCLPPRPPPIHKCCFPFIHRHCQQTSWPRALGLLSCISSLNVPCTSHQPPGIGEEQRWPRSSLKRQLVCFSVNPHAGEPKSEVNVLLGYCSSQSISSLDVRILGSAQHLITHPVIRSTDCRSFFLRCQSFYYVPGPPL